MGKFSGLLMVSDLDRTLFGDREEDYILPRNNKAIEYFMQNGGYFTFATGRGFVAAERLTKDVPKNAPAILFNGQMLYDFSTHKHIFADGITTENIKAYLGSLCDKFPDVPKIIFYGDKMFTVNDDEATRFMAARINMTGEKRNFQDVPLPWIKILCMAKEEVINEMMAYAATLDLTGLQCVCSTPVLMETMKAGVSKATGLQRLAEFLNVEMKNTIAVGDYYNDEPMLRAAGRAFVPENAAEDLKPLAVKVVCHHSKGAIADVVEWLDQNV